MVLSKPPPPFPDAQTTVDQREIAGIQVKSTSRFERQLVDSNFLDRLQRVNERTEVTIRKAKQDYSVRRLGYHGVVRRDPQYRVELHFSDDDGQSFSEPIFSVTGNRLYQFRVQLYQLQAEPLLRGFALNWRLPTGWAWTDALPAITYEEAASNPLVVSRAMRSPSNPQPAAFEVLVTELFR